MRSRPAIVLSMFILWSELVCSMLFNLWTYSPTHLVNKDLVVYDPIPFADVEYLTKEYYIYFMMEHYGLCLVAFLLCFYVRYVGFFLYFGIKLFDLIDYRLFYNTVWFKYEWIPVSFNVVAVTTFGVFTIIEALKLFSTNENTAKYA